MTDKPTAKNMQTPLSKQMHSTKQQWEMSLPILWEQLVISLLDGNILNDSTFQEIEFPLLITENVLLMMGRKDEGYPITRTNLYKLKNAVDGFIRHDILTNGQVFSVIYGDDILWMIQTDLCGSTDIINTIKSAMETIYDMCLKSFSVSMSMVLSESFVPFRDISVAWLGLTQTIKNLQGISHGMLLVEYDNHKLQSDKAEWLYIRNIMQQINSGIGRLQREKYTKSYTELITNLQNNIYQRSYSENLEIAMRIYMSFLSHSNSSGIRFETEFPNYFIQENAMSWELYDNFFAKLADDYFAKQQQSSFKNTTQVFGNLRQYIHNNLSGDTSLNKLAEIAHFSPTYLSRLFKQLTNVSLTEYIGRLKYEKATRLLIETDMKIVQIATELGFETQSYFSRFFKKYAKISPQEYRDKYWGGEFYSNTRLQ